MPERLNTYWIVYWDFVTQGQLKCRIKVVEQQHRCSLSWSVEWYCRSGQYCIVVVFNYRPAGWRTSADSHPAATLGLGAGQVVLWGHGEKLHHFQRSGPLGQEIFPCNGRGPFIAIGQCWLVLGDCSFPRWKAQWDGDGEALTEGPSAREAVATCGC